jgi:hypothetical protein
VASSNWWARGGEREREMEGGGEVASVPRGGREMGERERAPGVAVGSAGQRTWPATAPAIGRGRRRCCVNRGERWGAGDAARRYAVAMRSRVESGPDGSGRGTREREERGSVVMGR